MHMRFKSLLMPALAGLFTLIATSGSASAQVTLYGTLSNFDLVNDNTEVARGFEIEFEGASGIYSYYNSNRYGAPSVTPLPGGGGMLIRWASPYDPATGNWVTGTPVAVKPTVMTGHQCIIGTIGYETAGCEHLAFPFWAMRHERRTAGCSPIQTIPGS